MSPITLVTGGARSGKSAFAERLVAGAGSRAVYIATAEPGDEEMAARIAAHRARRDGRWTTCEAPLALVDTLRSTDGDAPRLVDCLTLWLSNLLLADRDWEQEADGLLAELSRQRAPVILVSNEVGSGLVPDTPLGRRFRDAAGRLNQQVAGVSDAVWLVVAGIPLRIKPGGPDA